MRADLCETGVDEMQVGVGVAEQAVCTVLTKEKTSGTANYWWRSSTWARLIPYD